jgi:hypothetical protein
MDVPRHHSSRGMRFFALVVLLLFSPVIKGQVHIHLDKIEGGDWLQLYLDQTGSEIGFVNGKEYYPYYYRSMNSPIFRADERRKASLTFDRRIYDNLVLQYDTYLDEVIFTYDTLFLGDKIRMVSLNKYNVSSFDLYFSGDTIHFRYYAKEKDPDFNLSDGFYEVVHDSKTKCIIRHQSEKYTILDSPGSYAFDDYLYKPGCYINTGDGYQKITSRKQFTRLFNSSSVQISRFLRTNRIRIKEADKGQISGVLKYYEKLN